MKKFGENAYSYLFLIIVFFVTLPPFYIIPFIHNSLTTTHSLARFFSIIILGLLLVKSISEKKVLRLNKNLSIIILLYFISQSISFFGALDVPAFLLEYKDVVFGIIIFLITIFSNITKSPKKIIIVLLASIFINLAFEAFVYFFPNVIYTYLQNILQDKYWAFFDYQFNRQRFFGDILIEALVPIIIYISIISKNFLLRTFYIILVGSISFLTIVSNWRSKLLVLCFSILFSVLIYFRKGSTMVRILILILPAFMLLGYLVSSTLLGHNTIDRILLSDQEDVKSINSRLTYWDESISISLSSPLIGIGLGNYFDYLSQGMQINNRSSLLQPSGSLVVIDNPHNIFFTALVNTGTLGLFSFLLMILFFLKQDVETLKKPLSPISAFIISFWALLLYATLNPGAFFSYQFLFWFLRGVIYKLQSDNNL